MTGPGRRPTSDLLLTVDIDPPQIRLRFPSALTSWRPVCGPPTHRVTAPHVRFARVRARVASSLVGGELRGDLTKVLAVVHGHFLLVLGRLALAVGPRDRAATVGRAAMDLRVIEEQRR